MSYEGIEVDMLSLGNADSILVTQWKAGIASRILIDGGNASDSEKVLRFLNRRGISFLDHIVCSHPHDDHAAGLIGAVESKNISFGTAWMHLPWAHVSFEDLGRALDEGEVSAKKVVKIIRESLETSNALYDAILARQKVPKEPFEGMDIGFLKVCGPTQMFYEKLLQDFTDYEQLTEMNKALESHERTVMLEEIFEDTRFAEASASTTGLGAAPTEPENNSATILGTIFGNDTLLLTSDAGVEALSNAARTYQLASLRWMQIPHHGSRRNITEDLIEHFAPRIAYVSASGEKKHPRRKVVNALKAAGARVYSTHYPTETNMCFHLGSVPTRPDYHHLTALYDAD